MSIKPKEFAQIQFPNITFLSVMLSQFNPAQAIPNPTHHVAHAVSLPTTCSQTCHTQAHFALLAS
jgi:hypothetical protein